MRGRTAAAAILVALVAGTAAAGVGGGAGRTLELVPLGGYATGSFNQTAAEIGAYDARTRRVFVTNSATHALDVLDVSNPAAPTKVRSIDLLPYGADPTSVAVDRSRVAVAVVATTKTDPGKVAFFDTDGEPLGAVTVGALPDMLVFTPNGRNLLVANEGEPNDAYTIDPEGSVAIVHLPGKDSRLGEAPVHFARLNGFPRASLDPSVRIVGPGASVAQDLEPESIAVAESGRTAWVTLQEGNAIAELDLESGEFTAIHGLGFKDHLLAGSALDPSDRDGPANGPAVKLGAWPVRGMFQPDAIASFRTGGRTYLVSANEGDARDYAGFAEEARVSALTLDPTAFPNGAALKANAQLGRLTVTRSTGDTDSDGDYDVLHPFGARSFSIWTDDGTLVFDSGDGLEALTAVAGEFNSDNAANSSWDTRSDNKGPEPEGIAVGQVKGRWYAFVGLERIGGVAVYDVTEPAAAALVDYVNTRNFAGSPAAGTAGDLGPEGIDFVPAAASPTGRALLVVTYEISGTTRLFDVVVG